MNKNLINAVIEQLGYDNQEDTDLLQTLEDISNNGAQGGFSGFVYHNELETFFRANKQEIILLAKESAEELGEDPLSMIANFNCLRDLKLSSFDVSEAIYTNEQEDRTAIIDAMCWFALEEVANYLTNN